jgi:hypothetical protein
MRMKNWKLKEELRVGKGFMTKIRWIITNVERDAV